MKNKDLFNKAMNNVHAPEELKNKTLERIMNNSNTQENINNDTFKKSTPKKKNNLILFKLLSACAVFVMVFGLGTFFYKNPDILDFSKNSSQNLNADLPRFENIEELKKVLAKANKSYNYKYTDGLGFEDATFTASDTSAANAEVRTQTKSESETNDFSKTNVQVEDVDEADIVKTDGKYIYLVKANMVFIVEADTLKIVGRLDFDEDDNDFIPNEIFVNGDKLVVLGTTYIFDEEDAEEDDEDYKQSRYYYGYYRNNKTATQAVVMDISNKSKAKEVRRVSLDGYYSNSRMIGDNVYLISNKSVYYYDGIKDKEILPFYIDSVDGNEMNTIQAEDIAYFGGTRNYSYMLVAGFSINDKKSANVETIFGASDTVYASTDNLYVVQEKYTSYGSTKSIIYKFNLDDAKIELVAKGSVKGYLNNQFSMDEYDGNLRVATTAYVSGITKNQLYVLDKDLVQIGSIKNMAIDEKIYSVRFIGKVGYIVTYKQIDPLFVIDLSDPTNPEIKGELKIPGYSSYLHPYDENHIIGIGYNTKTNEWGGTTNENMKMSMFDVSDLENPKEMFSIDIGDKYVSSEITSNHKALFYNKAKNLIGFPIRTTSDQFYSGRSVSKSGFVIFKIDLEKGFEEYGDILEKTDYSNPPKRVIYIGDILYTIFDDNIDSYDLNTLKSKDTVEIK